MLPSLLAASLLLPATVAMAEPLAAATQATVQADWILERIARPAPSRTAFVELRGSKLLKQPLRIVGEYRHPDADTLVREVRAPYAETTTIRAGEAVIERAGKSPRRVSLSRVPELAGIQSSFGAMLSGDAGRLRQHYTLDADGSRQDWRMTLVPRDARLAERVRNIVLHGRGAELRCIETVPADAGEVQRTLLAGAARDAAAVDDVDALAALCDGAATR